MNQPSETVKTIKKVNDIPIDSDMFCSLVTAIHERFKSLPLDAKPYDSDLMMFISVWVGQKMPTDRDPLFGMALILRYFAFSKIVEKLPADQAMPVDEVREYTIKESAIKAAAITPLLYNAEAKGLDIARFDEAVFLENARRLAIELADKEETATA